MSLDSAAIIYASLSGRADQDTVPLAHGRSR
jgi:hypothetical protein